MKTAVIPAPDAFVRQAFLAAERRTAADIIAEVAAGVRRPRQATRPARTSRLAIARLAGGAGRRTCDGRDDSEPESTTPHHVCLLLGSSSPKRPGFPAFSI